MEHLEHFGLSRDPFNNDPQVAAYFESGEHASAAKRLQRAVEQQKGLCLFTGPAGGGKSMVVRHLLDALEEEVFEACVLLPVPGVADGRWVLARLAGQLGVEEPAEERGALLAQVYDQLAVVREEGRHTVLFVDEAEVLAERDALADLRVLLNLEYEERRLLTLVLVGTERLEGLVAGQPGLAERLEIHVRLGALDLDAATRYLTHRIRRVGGSPAILEAAALPTLIERAGGVPRRLNTLADNALFEAFLAGRVSATQADIARAADDLELGGRGAARPGPARGPVAGVASDPGRATELMPGGFPAGTDLGSSAPDLFAAGPGTPGRGMPDITAPGRGMADKTMILSRSGSDDDDPVLAEFEEAPPTKGPPKEDEIDDLFVDLVDD